jgi:hypothetical protein
MHHGLAGFLDEASFWEICLRHYVPGFPRGDRREGAGKRHPRACDFRGTIRQDDGQERRLCLRHRQLR